MDNKITIILISILLVVTILPMVGAYSMALLS